MWDKKALRNANRNLSELNFHLGGGWQGVFVNLLALLIRYSIIGFAFSLGWKILKLIWR